MCATCVGAVFASFRWFERRTVANATTGQARLQVGVRGVDKSDWMMILGEVRFHRSRVEIDGVSGGGDVGDGEDLVVHN